MTFAVAAEGSLAEVVAELRLAEHDPGRDTLGSELIRTLRMALEQHVDDGRFYLVALHGNSNIDQPFSLAVRVRGGAEPGLRRRLESLLNGAEGGSNTPDFILASYLVRCLDTFDEHVRAREDWYGHRHAPAGETEPGQQSQLAL